MNFIRIDKALDQSSQELISLLIGIYNRDRENKKYRIRKVLKKPISKGRKLYRHLFLKRSPRRIFAVCHPDELHFALGLCKKCYDKQHRDNAPPAICHPNKKTFRKKLCKPCYRKLHPENRKIKMINPIDLAFSFFNKYYKIKPLPENKGQTMKFRRYNA